MKLTLNIPEDVWQAIRLPEIGKQNHLLLELAITLYQRSILSLGKARVMANLTKWEFDEELRKRNIERHYDQQDMENDLKYGSA